MVQLLKGDLAAAVRVERGKEGVARRGWPRAAFVAVQLQRADRIGELVRRDGAVAVDVPLFEQVDDAGKVGGESALELRDGRRVVVVARPQLPLGARRGKRLAKDVVG